MSLYNIFTPTIFFVSKILLRSQGCPKDEVNLATLSFQDITVFKTVVSVFVPSNRIIIDPTKLKINEETSLLSAIFSREVITLNKHPSQR